MPHTPHYASPYAALSRPPLSKAALTSMILGFLGCIPLITSLLALIFALVGFRATRRGARGRGFAIAGLNLAILGLGAWAFLGVYAGFLLADTGIVLRDFVHNVSTGNTAAAVADCDPSIHADQLAALHIELAKYGTYTDLTRYGVNFRTTPMGEICTLTGLIYFSHDTKMFNAVLTKDPAGRWRVLGFHVT